MTKMPAIAAASMPPNTAVPTARRLAAPAPVRDHQRHEAEDEGEAGHHDGAEAQLRGLHRGVRDRHCPCVACSIANSTIRMAFLAASAISTTMPICA